LAANWLTANAKIVKEKGREPEGARPNPFTKSSLGWINMMPLILAFEAIVHVVEGVFEVVAKRTHSSNSSNCDKSGDQAILDCGCTFFILEKLLDHFHLRSPVQL
jgi:hypothetical protein